MKTRSGSAQKVRNSTNGSAHSSENAEREGLPSPYGFKVEEEKNEGHYQSESFSRVEREVHEKNHMRAFLHRSLPRYSIQSCTPDGVGRSMHISIRASFEGIENLERLHTFSLKCSREGSHSAVRKGDTEDEETLEKISHSSLKQTTVEDRPRSTAEKAQRTFYVEEKIQVL